MNGSSSPAKSPISLSRKVFFVFCLLFFIIVINFSILLKTQKTLKERNKWVLHTHEVIRESEKFLGSLRDMETGQRGFLLTINQKYLEPFRSGIKQSEIQYRLLKKLTEDNLEQQNRLEKIQTLTKQKISELEKTILLTQQNQKKEALVIVNSDRGKIIMDAIRGIVKELISVEESLLKQRKTSYLEKQSFLKKLFYLEAAIIITILLLSYISIQKNIVSPLKKMTGYFLNGIDASGEETYIQVNNKQYEIGILTDAINRMHHDIKLKSEEKDSLISQLKEALDEVNMLKGILPICSFCKKIRDDNGAWNQIEEYISQNSDADFSHGVCPECLKKYYPEDYKDMLSEQKKT